MRLPTENITLETEEQCRGQWSSIDLEAGFLYWEEAKSKARSQGEKKLAEARIREILNENHRLLAQQRFEEFLQAHGIEYKTGDEAAAEDFDRAIWEYHLWGRIPLWLKTVISCSAIGIFYSVAVGSRHLSQYRYHPISRWKHPVPVQTSQILELVQVLPEIETLGIFGIVRKETDPILAAKVTGQWYKLYEWE